MICTHSYDEKKKKEVLADPPQRGWQTSFISPKA